MIVNAISIAREGYYGGGYGSTSDASKPFIAKIDVGGHRGKIELLLSAEMSQRIVAIIADEVAAAGRETAEAMTADVLNVKALAKPGAAQ